MHVFSLPAAIVFRRVNPLPNPLFFCHIGRLMKFSFIKTCTALIAVAAAGLTTSAAQAISTELPLDGYAATVNERIITIGDVMISIQEAEERLRVMRSGTSLAAERDELFRSGLERLIDHALILEDFKKQEGIIPDRAIDDRINEIIYDRFNNDRSALLTALANDQITLEEWRETIRDRIVVNVMRRREVGEKIVISPRQLREAYESRQDLYQQPEQVHFRLIFVKQGDDSDASLKRITASRDRIVSGKSFADEAKAISEDTSASLGGDWGMMEPSVLRDELRNALAATATGEVSDIVITPEGYYLLKVENRREAYTKSFEEVRLEIEKELREKESERMYRAWIERLRNKYSVIYYLPVPPRQS